MIECLFFIKVIVNTSGSCTCCGDKPEIESNFLIVPNSITIVQNIQPPPGWNPNVYDQVSFEYNQRFESNKPLGKSQFDDEKHDSHTQIHGG